MDAVAVPEDVGGHPGVPETGLMSEMDARFQHLAHGHIGHGGFPHFVRVLGLTRIPGGDSRPLGREHPAASVETRGDWFAKNGRALYHEVTARTMSWKSPGTSESEAVSITIKSPQDQEKMRVAGRL